MLMSQMWSYM
ncbi:hypothetical protein F383_27164 [Gossypium arboreum]|uniref:Uncharacterized protein n=1 Tax=Gossypium arboreum TaxID=29729 RepID=A0A0B0P2F3_GOSAR|nr:hypothetical protein F383_27164 [Gossypium arboreum]